MFSCPKRIMWLPFVCFLCFYLFLYFCFLFIYFNFVSLLCPLQATMSLAGYFLARLLLSAFSDFFLRTCYVPGLVWFGSVCRVTTAGFVGDQSSEINSNNNNNANCSTTIPATVAQSLAFPLFSLNSYPVSFMNLTLGLMQGCEFSS